MAVHAGITYYNVAVTDNYLEAVRESVKAHHKEYGSAAYDSSPREKICGHANGGAGAAN